MKKPNKIQAFTIAELSIVLLIIAIIIGGVLASRNMLTSARLSTLRSISAKSPIYDIPDNTFWLDVAAKRAFTGYPSNGNTISSMFDVSPNLNTNINLVQATAANRPKFVFDTVDGLPLIRYDGVDDILASSVPIFGYQLAVPNQVTLLVVQKFSNGSNSTFAWNQNGGNNRFSIHAPLSSGGLMYFDFGNISAGGRINSSAPANFDNTWKILTFVRGTGASNNAQIRINGVNFYTATMTSLLNIDTSTILNIGAGLGASTLDLREIILFKRELSAAEITDIENYLSVKWKINID